jgi:glycosyltransferase involved in cell wall biosynthesis
LGEMNLPDSTQTMLEAEGPGGPLPRRGAVFVMPTSSSGQPGPVAVWITASGWAAAARRMWGQAWVVTPEGVLSPENAREVATRPRLKSGARPSWKRHVPRSAATMAKDAGRLVRARRFGHAARSGPWDGSDLVFVWQRHDLFHTAGFQMARAKGCPVVLFVDAPTVWEERRWGVRRPGWGSLLERVGELPQFHSADLVACVSEEVAEALVARGVPEDRVLVTPCVADLDVFTPEADRGGLREELGLTDRFVVGWVGSFRRFHGVELALEAAASLQDSIPNLSLLLVGDGLERPRLERMAQDLGLRDVVFTGTVSYEDMPRHIAAMDLALVLDPGTGEFHYSPLKLREYMACGRAVVAPRVGQVGRFLTDGVDALMVDPGDARALARAIEQVHREPGLRRALESAARRKVAAEGSWDRQVLRAVEAMNGRARRPA